MTEKEINITKIAVVAHIAPKSMSGDTSYYTRKNGLPNHEFVYRLNGNIKVDFDNHIMYNTQNTIEFLPKGQGNDIYKVTVIEPGECINVHFDTDFPLYDTAVLIAPKYYTDLRHLFLEINKVWFQKSDGYYYEAMSLLYKIINILTVREQKSGYGPHYKKIKIGVEYINEYYCNPDLDYEKIAAMCDISYVYFRKLFSECMKASPSEYVMKKRIDYAKELLMSGQYKISDIAEITGFCDVYYFSRVFKKITGISPSKYFT